MRAYLVPGVLAILTAGLVGAFPARAEEPKKAVETKAPTFAKDVAPLLKNACANCHSGAKQKARLDVTSYDSLVKFVKAGDPDKSRLHKALLGKGAKLMPPKNPLAAEQVAVVKDWIAAGAKKD